MSYAIWILIGLLATFVLVLVGMLLEGAGLIAVIEGVTALDVERIKHGGLLITVGAALLAAVGIVAGILKSRI